jgi:hypothetical protein
MTAGRKRSLFTRENILLALGILIIGGSFINSEVLGRTFHYEFLLLGGALCGVGVAQLGDRGK